ncbi:MAG: glycosyltransferase [Flammeovirgaceae bacterium]|jgi:glycosyltransferase involved in cell wall biosynthesis|nr:glycosyltransferase [Flammeovirgaceae bacterium]
MKIIHIIESSGGSADFVLYLIKYLPAHDHTVIYGERTFGNRFSEVKNANSSVDFLFWNHVQREVKIYKDFKAAISLYRLLKKVESNAIHLHSSKAGFLGRVVCFFMGKKNVIYTPNGLAFARKDVGKFTIEVYIILEKFANYLNGRVIGCSKSEAQEMINRGITATYISNGTEIFDYQNNGDLKYGNLIIATTGRVTIQKNPILFNRIASNFNDIDGVKFVWIGGGELEYCLTSKNIEVTGWVNRERVINELAKANLYLSTALWEGLPFAVLEAMNLGKPLLLSDCVGNVDLVENGYNGYLYSSEHEAIDKIKLIISDLTKTKLFGRASNDLVRKSFNVEDMARKYEQAYSDSKYI